VANCKIDCRSPEYNKLRETWKKSYPHIDEDLEDAFKAIRKNVDAKNCRIVPRHGTGVVLRKYRQNSIDIARGASYGWRLHAIHDEESNTLYPILVYPKTVWEDASTERILAAIEELLATLRSGATEKAEQALEAACPNCGESTRLVRRVPFLECPDCQRAYRQELDDCGKWQLVIASD
jgi:hypothetical protein